MEKSTIVNQVVSTLEAVKSYGLPGFWILVVSVLIVLVLVIAALVYQRIAIKRFPTPSKVTQENFEATAAYLRKRAWEVKKQDEGLKKRELEVKDEPQRPQQQRQVLKRSQRTLKGSVSHTMLSSKADLQRKLEDGGVKNS
jgi:CBS-domain-containing membrane protein